MIKNIIFKFIINYILDYILFFLIKRGVIWVSHLRIIRVLAEFLVPLEWQMTATKYRNSTSASMGSATFCENILPPLKFINFIYAIIFNN